MDYQISDEVREKTNQCPHEFGCLTGEKTVCSASQPIAGDGIFIRRPQDVFCPYLMHFGNSHICNCPARRELYERYQI